MDENDTHLTSRDVIAFLGISSRTLSRWEDDPSLAFPQAMIINNRRYWRKGDLLDWAKARAVQAGGGS